MPECPYYTVLGRRYARMLLSRGLCQIVIISLCFSACDVQKIVVVRVLPTKTIWIFGSSHPTSPPFRFVRVCFVAHCSVGGAGPLKEKKEKGRRRRSHTHKKGKHKVEEGKDNRRKGETEGKN